MMKKRLQRISKRIICIMLALCVGSSSCIAYAVSKETQDKIDKAEQEKEEAERQKKETQQEQSNLSNAKEEMENYLSDLNQQSKSLNEQVSILTTQMQQKETEVEEKKAEVEEAQEELDQQYQDMKKRIQYMYENGQDVLTTYMVAMLEGGIADFLNQVEYASNINTYDRDMLENFKTSKAELESEQAELEDEQEALELLKTEVEKKKEQVAAQQAAAGTKLSEYEQLLLEKEGELLSADELVAEKTKILNQLIAKAEEEERQAKIAAAQQAAASMASTTIIAADAGISTGQKSLSEYEILLLATIIYCEAGNQGTEGQLAVGYVVMNRVRSNLFPNSLESVLRQSKQFEPVGSGRFDLVLQAEQDPDIPNIVTQSCWNAARTVINGTSNVGESLFFRTWAPVPQLITNLKNGNVPYWIIKDHVFYYYWTSYSNTTTTTTTDEEEPEEEPVEEPEEDSETEEETPEEDPVDDEDSEDDSDEDTEDEPDAASEDDSEDDTDE